MILLFFSIKILYPNASLVVICYNWLSFTITIKRTRPLMTTTKINTIENQSLFFFPLGQITTTKETSPIKNNYRLNKNNSINIYKYFLSISFIFFTLYHLIYLSSLLISLKMYKPLVSKNHSPKKKKRKEKQVQIS